MDCMYQNGNITGYSVRYGVRGSGEEDKTVENATGESSGGIHVISGLSAATVYEVEVAAVNSAGIGVYSDPVETPQSKYTLCVLYITSFFIFIHCL